MAKKKEKKYELISASAYEESDIKVSLGNPVLDGLVGGGIPVGRVVEIFGEWSTGKTILAWTILREAQKLGAFTFLAETEASFSKSFCAKCGVDLSKLKMLTHTKEQPITVPWFFTVAEKEMRKAQRHYPFSVIVLDSLAALNSAMRDADGGDSYGKFYVADVARQMSQGLNRFQALLYPWKGILVIVNQIRDNVGIMWGDKTVTPGGRALKFYSDLRLQLKPPKAKFKTEEDVKVGFFVAKSKLAKPFGKALARISFETGLDPEYGWEEKEVAEEVSELPNADD